MTDVRAAVPGDRAGILALCEALHSENGQHPISWPKVAAMVDRGIARENAVFGVIGEIGEPVGAVLLLLDPVWYSDDFQLLEMFNFVHTEHRKSDYAKSLIEYAKACSVALGIDLTIGVLSNERMQSKVRCTGGCCRRPARSSASGRKRRLPRCPSPRSEGQRPSQRTRPRSEPTRIAVVTTMKAITTTSARSNTGRLVGGGMSTV